MGKIYYDGWWVSRWACGVLAGAAFGGLTAACGRFRWLLMASDGVIPTKKALLSNSGRDSIDIHGNSLPEMHFTHDPVGMASVKQ